MVMFRQFQTIHITKINFSRFENLDKGDLFGWGNSEYGQLRLATSEMQLHTPKQLKLPSTFGKIKDVASSGTACMILNGKLLK